MGDGGGAAYSGDAFFSCEDYAKFAIVRDAVINHELVARLENVQRQRGAGIEDDAEWEQWYAGVGHDRLHSHCAWATRKLTQQRQGSLHFVARVHVAGILRHENSVG